jgi:hypothetical protein
MKKPVHSVCSPIMSNRFMICSYDSPFFPKFFNCSLVSFVITIVVSTYHVDESGRNFLLITYNYV